MADIAIQPIWQVLDGNGNPYPAARATFFLSGTSTPLTVYTDIGLTVAHPVPVVADANGVFPPVYLGSAAAKAVITTSTGAAIKTVDPVPKTTASSTGAAQVSFAPTAAIPSTTVQAAIEQVQANLEGSSTAFVKTLLDDTTATAFMTTLGGTAAGQAVFKAADAAAQRATLGIPLGTAGQVLATNDAANGLIARSSTVWATAQYPTSGTQFDFTGIPPWATEIIIAFQNISFSGTDNLLVQLGTSGGLVTSGYGSTSGTIDTSVTGVITSTSGIIVFSGAATDNLVGEMRFLKPDATQNLWISSHTMTRSSAKVSMGGGSIGLGAALDRVRITRTGTNTFDGSASVLSVGWRG